MLTNTLTARDAAELHDRGVAQLVTTTPDFEGRSFGTNVLEAALVALSGKAWADLSPADYARSWGHAVETPVVVGLDGAARQAEDGFS